MRTTEPRARVLEAFLADPHARRYGYELMKLANLQSGTLYPLLSRLQDEGMVTSQWEAPTEPGQRPRRYYELTGEGVRAARLELAEAGLAQRQGARPQGARRPATGGIF
ncbi:MAG TPA: helix-turn-helix transcriptional regulator [Actinocrinis sp.]|jgi:DNA-binding PadR family transcriptional regulator|uniref:PadR family transcriptional regulator n=1 Tax=Actinocrinis sp. TaxID=1920516 RepID=UPI002D55BE4A|nr:helix-turn-helix transcriptional regulator [Actinocrinis sp.]HZU56661.1 helix-turn-helix transcriptional regulator [Actinocrinis sp.]